MSQQVTVHDNIDAVLYVLQAHNVSSCIIGELALNYYNNVPRVVHDLEFCVAKDDLSRGSQALASAQDLFAPADEEEFSIYTEYRRAMPQFRFRDCSSLCVVLFPDVQVESAGLLDNIIPLWLHRSDSEYSLELDDIPTERIPSLPFPLLGPLLSRYCISYVASNDIMAATAIDGLIDGMDLDEQWCVRHLSQVDTTSIEYALSGVRGKLRRIDYYQDKMSLVSLRTKMKGRDFSKSLVEKRLHRHS